VLERGADAGFWAGRRVLLTGHTGFKGSWLSLWLQQLGSHVAGYSAGVPTTPSLFELARVGEGMESIAGDVRDLGALTAAVASTAPEIVIHMAAQPLVRRSLAEPLETYETNVMGTVNLLQAVRTAGPQTRAVIVVTSDKCYENDERGTAFSEGDPLGGDDPYSSSKAAAELVVQAFRHSYFSGAHGAGEQAAPAT
jgi:CDP-glucose 4,6-dehydratase